MHVQSRQRRPQRRLAFGRRERPRSANLGRVCHAGSGLPSPFALESRCDRQLSAAVPVSGAVDRAGAWLSLAKCPAGWPLRGRAGCSRRGASALSGPARPLSTPASGTACPGRAGPAQTESRAGRGALGGSFDGAQAGSSITLKTIRLPYNRSCTRLYDSLMVTQITLNMEPHGFDSCRGHFTTSLPRTVVHS